MCRAAVPAPETDVIAMLVSDSTRSLPLFGVALLWISAPPEATVNLPPRRTVLEVSIVVTPETAPAFVMFPPRLSMPCSMDP